MGHHHSECVLFCHRRGLIGPKIDEPESRPIGSSRWILCLLNDFNAMSIDVVDAAIAIDVQAAAKPDPFLAQCRQRGLDALANDPAHVVLFDMAALATSPQHHEEQFFVSAHCFGVAVLSAWATTARQWAMNSLAFFSPLAAWVSTLRTSKFAVLLSPTEEMVG